MSDADDFTLGESVETLEGEASGAWLVTTRGSRHVWDLDAFTYTRLPGAQSADFGDDRTTHKITRVERWPSVGDYSVVFYDDSDYPLTVEQWRSSSTVRSIKRIDPISSKES